MKLLTNNAKEYIILGLIYTLIIIPLAYFGIIMGMGIYILPAVAALPLLYFVFKKPQVWLYTSMFLFIFFTRSREAEASPFDYFFAIYYIGGLLLWILGQLLYKREKLVRNYGDMFILLYSIGVLLNFFIAYSAGVDPMNWLREATTLFLVLFYFPIRHYFYDEQKLKPFMIFFGVVLIIISCISIYTYYLALSDIQYAFQLASSDKINQMIFTVGVIFGLVFTFYQKKRKNEIYLLIFIGFIGVSLILTFSRTFWLIVILMSVVLFLYLPVKKKTAMFKVGMALIVLGVLSFFLLLGDNTEMISTLLEKRISSASSGTKDESLQARFVEWDYALGEIQKYPLGGKGMGNKVHFYNILVSQTFHTLNIHNGYIFFCFKLGIPMALVYLSFFLFYTFKAFFLSLRKSSLFFKALSIACFLGFISVLIANTTSMQFVYRDGHFTIFLLIAFTSIADYNINSPKRRENLIETNNILPDEANNT
ncbi:MAG: O-antigen ligase family protein [bacterium]